MTEAPNLAPFEETVLNQLKTDDDAGRVLALERYDVLDTQEERPFENIVNLIGQILAVPMSAVTLVHTNRQWFKARRGLPAETPRNVSFCTYAIQQPEPLIIPDAKEDPRFAENPLVTGEPFIRAYMGVPLRTPDGYNIGSLCAIDTKPRDWPEHERSILINFAKVVMDELELRQIANADVLTGAMTRRAWMESAEAEIKRARRYGHPLSLVVMDIDRFKSVNDTHGHAAGDEVIKGLAGLMMDGIREQDAFGRYGGEEFVLLMPETDGPQAFEVADRLRLGFAGLRIEAGGGVALSCTCSMGLAVLEPDETLDEFIKRADRCLYAAKEEGRDRVIAEDRS